MNELARSAAPDYDIDRLALVASFLAVAQRQSFTLAASALGISVSTLSRKIARLESSLGIRLFDRTTRRVTLTEVGRLYFDRCRVVAEQLADADRMIEAMVAEPRGLLRISMPVAFGRLVLSPLIHEFMDRYPQVQIQSDYSDSYVDLVRDGYDVAIRIGALQDSELVARRVASSRRLVVASPSYLESHGAPQHPAELAAHQCLVYTRYSDAGAVWRFKMGDALILQRVGGNFRTDNSEAILEAALHGRGIGLVANYMCHDSIRRGALVQLLPGFVSEPSSNIHIVYTSRKNLSPRIKELSNFLARKLRGI